MSRGHYVQCSPFAVQQSPTGSDSGATYSGVDIIGSEQSPEHFHYLMNEQAKSLAALHELQNEVGALLEFRDLVIETFPHLRNKMAVQPSSTGAPSSSNTTPSSSSTGMSHIPVPTSRREWEPGIRVKRKLGNKEQEANVSSLTLSRSRSNSQGSKYQSSQLLCGGANTSGSGTSSTGSSAVQDSGFGTESKEHYSASSSASHRGSAGCAASAEDELWNLLDVIHRKGSRLRQEVEHLQIRLQDKETHSPDRGRDSDRDRCRARSLGSVPSGEVARDARLSTSRSRLKLSRSDKCFLDLGDEFSDRLDLGEDDSRDSRDSTDYRTQRLLELGREEVRGLRRERDLLLDRLAEMEAEMLASRARASHFKTEVGSLTSAKRELEEQLESAMSQKSELNARIHDLHLQFVKNGGKVLAPAKRAAAPQVVLSYNLHVPRKISSHTVQQAEPSCFAPVHPSSSQEDKVTDSALEIVHSTGKESVFSCQPLDDAKLFQTVEKVVDDTHDSSSVSGNDPVLRATRSECQGRHAKLGALDGIISTPAEIPKYIRGVAPDPDRIAAVLQETDHVELQRHLLTSMAENKALRLQTVTELKVREGLAHQLDSVREENDDLRFQLEERNIELEGTRARVRVLERMQQVRYPSEPEAASSALPVHTNDDQAAQHSSSTESAHDTEGPRAPATTPTPSEPRLASCKTPVSPRRRPSKIPLVKSYCAPKPPVGKTSHDGMSNSTTSISSGGRDTLKRRKECRTAASSPASRGTSTPDGTTMSWRHRRDSSPSLGPGGRSRDSLSSSGAGAGRSSSASIHHGSRESLGGPRSRSTPAKNDTPSKNHSLASSSSLSRREMAKSRDSIHSSPGGRKLHPPQLRRNSVNTSLNRTNGVGEPDQAKGPRSNRLFSWGNWWKIGILDSPS